MGANKVVQGRRQPTSPFFLYCLLLPIAASRWQWQGHEERVVLMSDLHRPSIDIHFQEETNILVFWAEYISGLSNPPVHAQSICILVDKRTRHDACPLQLALAFFVQFLARFFDCSFHKRFSLSMF